MAPKPVAPLEGDGLVSFSLDPRELEALIFTAVGAAIAFLLAASLIFVVCQCATRTKARAGQAGQGQGNYHQVYTQLLVVSL